jgi:hypothetical protein
MLLMLMMVAKGLLALFGLRKEDERSQEAALRRRQPTLFLLLLCLAIIHWCRSDWPGYCCNRGDDSHKRSMRRLDFPLPGGFVRNWGTGRV